MLAQGIILNKKYSRLIRRPSPPALNTINNSTKLEPEKQRGKNPEYEISQQDLPD
jgi:hypothetical protein